MPGFNQRGPMNEGPMTGRKMGQCVVRSTGDGGTAPDLSWDTPGFGRGRGMAMGRGRCRHTWPGIAAAEYRQLTRQLQPAGEETMAEKVQQLEMELETLKNEIRQMNKHE